MFLPLIELWRVDFLCCHSAVRLYHIGTWLRRGAETPTEGVHTSFSLFGTVWSHGINLGFVLEEESAINGGTVTTRMTRTVTSWTLLFKWMNKLPLFYSFTVSEENFALYCHHVSSRLVLSMSNRCCIQRPENFMMMQHTRLHPSQSSHALKRRFQPVLLFAVAEDGEHSCTLLVDEGNSLHEDFWKESLPLPATLSEYVCIYHVLYVFDTCLIFTRFKNQLFKPKRVSFFLFF